MHLLDYGAPAMNTPASIRLPAVEPISVALEPAVLALNNEHATELSLLDAERLSYLLRQSFMSCRIGDLEAFMICFDQDADYDSVNFRWFRDRYPRFAYVDRIAVAPSARGRGHARRLYEHFFALSRAAGHNVVAAEVNSEPPNPASDAFHAALGFHIVGQAEIYGGERTVRYLAREL